MKQKKREWLKLAVVILCLTTVSFSAEMSFQRQGIQWMFDKLEEDSEFHPLATEPFRTILLPAYRRLKALLPETERNLAQPFRMNDGPTWFLVRFQLAPAGTSRQRGLALGHNNTQVALVLPQLVEIDEAFWNNLPGNEEKARLMLSAALLTKPELKNLGNKDFTELVEYLITGISSSTSAQEVTLKLARWFSVPASELAVGLAKDSLEKSQPTPSPRRGEETPSKPSPTTPRKPKPPEPSPSPGKPSPSQEKPLPVKTKPAPVKANPEPEKQMPDPVKQNPDPVQQKPEPVKQKPEPTPEPAPQAPLAWTDVSVGSDGRTRVSCSVKDDVECAFRDNRTLKIWSRVSAPFAPSETWSWARAERACTWMDWGGLRSGWRLPTNEELRTAYLDGLQRLTDRYPAFQSLNDKTWTEIRTGGVVRPSVFSKTVVGAQVAATEKLPWICVHEPVK